MRSKKVILVAAVAALFCISVNEVSAHAGLPHRHFHGRVYYWAGCQHHPALWSDDCGTVWSYGDVAIDREYRVTRVNPLPEEVLKTETRTSRETTTRRTTTRTTTQTDK